MSIYGKNGIMRNFCEQKPRSGAERGERRDLQLHKAHLFVDLGHHAVSDAAGGGGALFQHAVQIFLVRQDAAVFDLVGAEGVDDAAATASLNTP